MNTHRIAALTLPLVANVTLAELTVEATAFTDAMSRGVALADGEPGVGLSADWDFDSGWFVGGGGYYAGGSPTGQSLTQNVHAHVGWFAELADERALELSLSHYAFPDVSDWSYSEARADLHLSHELSLTGAWSPDYYGRDASALVTGATWRPPLGRSAYLHTAGGMTFLGGRFDELTWYGEAGVGLKAGRFDLVLTYHRLDQTFADILLRPEDTVAFRINYLLR